MTYTGIGYKKWALNCYDPYNMFWITNLQNKKRHEDAQMDEIKPNVWKLIFLISLYLSAQYNY